MEYIEFYDPYEDLAETVPTPTEEEYPGPEVKKKRIMPEVNIGPNCCVASHLSAILECPVRSTCLQSGLISPIAPPFSCPHGQVRPWLPHATACPSFLSKAPTRSCCLPFVLPLHLFQKRKSKSVRKLQRTRKSANPKATPKMVAAKKSAARKFTPKKKKVMPGYQATAPSRPTFSLGVTIGQNVASRSFL